MSTIKEVDDFTNEIVRKIQPNLEVLLLLGSRMRMTVSIFSDYDFVCVLKRHNTKDLTKLRDLVSQTTFYTDMPVLFRDEIPRDPSRFTVANQGYYHLEVLKRAHTLYGRNIFLDYPAPPTESLRLSLLQKVFEYHMNMRRQYVDANRSLSSRGNYMINRRMVKAVQNLLWALGDDSEMSEQTVVTKFLQRYPDVLSARQRTLLYDLADPNNVTRHANDLSSTFLFRRLLVMEKITMVARQIAS